MTSGQIFQPGGGTPLPATAKHHVGFRKVAASLDAPRSLARYLALSSVLAVPALAAPLLVGVSPAYADCDPQAVNGVVATCTGDTTNQGDGAPGTSADIDGYGVGSVDIESLTVQLGATVTGDFDGVEADRITSLTNSGTITGVGFEGVEAVRIITLTNSGTITGGSDGIDVDRTLTTLTNSGTIEGSSDGIDADTINTLDNSGAITGVFNGVEVDRTLTTLTNSGTITGSSQGIDADTITTLINGGTIIGSAFDGIDVDSNIATLTNSGTITGGFYGVDADTINTLTNSGTIIASTFVGIRVRSTLTTLTNSGTITGFRHGIDATNITSLVNSGTITGGSDGIVVDRTLTTLTNSGTIEGSLDGVDAETITTLTNSGTITGGRHGVDAQTITSVINSGRITGARGDGLIGAFIDGFTNSGTISGANDGVSSSTIQSLTNTGTISGGDVGVQAFGNLVSLTNSGTISGGTYAIEEVQGGDSALTLNAGSVLIGRIDLGGGTNTLNIGEGLSLNSTFETDGTAIDLPILGTTADHLIAILDTGGRNREVVAVDQSAFTSFDDALAALTTGIGQTLQDRQTALRSDPALSFASRFAAAEETNLVAFSDLDLDDAPHLNSNRFWIEGFGSYRQGESDRVGGDFDHLTGGLVAGVDVPLDALTGIGIMAGFAANNSENEINTQQTDASSFYAGVYASTQAMGMAWDASLTVGYTDYSQERITANNLVATGLETASANFGGWFINPQVTVTNSMSTGFAPTSMGFGLASVEQSLTLAYAGLFLDGYTETGTTNPLTLNDRNVHIASARAALALPFERVEADGALTTVRLIGGLEVRAQFGDDDVSGILLGQAVSTTSVEEGEALGAFVGLSGEHQTTSGLTAYANAEALIETSSAFQISATAGLRIAF